MSRRIVLTIAATMLAACAYVPPQDRAAAPAAEPAPVRRATLADNGAEIALKLGEEFEIAIDDQPSTGYAWDVVAGVDDAGDPDRSEVLSTIMAFRPQRASDSAEPPPGAPGEVVWRFRAIRPGSGMLRLEYRRPWEKDASPARQATYRIDVK